MSNPKDGGGVRIHNVHERNVILGEKLAWKYYDNSLALWVKIMRINYLDEEGKDYEDKLLR